MPTFNPPFCDFVWLVYGQVLCVLSQSPWQWPCCFRKTVSFKLSPPLALTISQSLSSEKVPKLWRYAYPILGWAPSLHADQVNIYVLIAIYCKKKLLWRWLKDILISGCIEKPLGIVQILYPLNRIIVLRSSIEPKTYLATVSWSY